MAEIIIIVIKWRSMLLLLLITVTKHQWKEEIAEIS